MQRERFFDQFEMSHWNQMRKCWLSSELGHGVPRTNNALERHNQHIKADFTENLLLPVNDFLASFRLWASKESRRFSSSHAHSPMKHIADKTHVRDITRIRHVWREGQQVDFNFLKKGDD